MTMTCEHCSKPVTGQYCHSCSRAAKKSAGGGTGRKALGLCLIIGPWVGLMIVLSAYAMASFISSAVTARSAQALFIESVYAESLATEDFFDSGFADSEILGDPEIRALLDEEYGELETDLGNLAKVVLGLMGGLCILGIFVGTPVGIYLLATDGKPKAT